MHILFLTDNFPPEVNAPASRTFEHCREWVNSGHRVTVVTCAPNFPTGKIFTGYRNRLWSRENIEGIDVIRVWTYITANEGFLRRTLDYVSFSIAAVPASLFVRNVDLIVATSPQIFAPCAALISGLLKRRPYVFELRDLWPESIRAVGAMKNSTALRWLERLELLLYRKSATVVAVTEAFRDNLVGRGIERSKIHIVMNGADLSRFRPLPRNQELARRLGLEDKFVAGYVGTHGMAHHLSTLLEAAALIGRKPGLEHVRLLFLGNGAEKSMLKAKAAEMGLENVLFLDSVPRAEVPDYWSLLDVSIIHLRKTPLFETVIPSKLFECMAMGIPVLHGVVGESADIVTREDVGLCFEPEGAEQLAGLIHRVQQDPDELSRMARNAIVAARQFDRSASAFKMLNILSDVVQASSRRAVRQAGNESAGYADRADGVRNDLSP